jgi:hypothetical protein
VEPVTDLVLVDEQLGPRRELGAHVGVEAGEHRAGLVVQAEGQVLVGHVELGVGVQVVGRREQADDRGEPLLADPDDLLLATHPRWLGP